MTTKPTKIYLKDYQAPNFTVSKVNLDIKLFDDHATVDSVINMQKQSEGDLILLGRDLQLIQLEINGQIFNEENYQLDEEQLVIKKLADGSTLPNELTVKTQVKIVPQKNTSLEGLYIAGEGDDVMFTTQCEAEGFRKITFYPDRPDVLAEFTTRVEADKKFPTLLSNGHLIEQGELANNRHFKIWHDPAKKPSYLFACVIADLSVMQDKYTTIEGREVLLEIYAKEKDIEKCHVAMQALKDSMKWDEDNYGRAYDLDRFMIVAVSQFNMGAMENKGLNIFNTACVLSTPEKTTDPRTSSVKGIIAHEYFHNWTGNRITCRDWFQLCLKEGLTVFRDQSFSADHQSPAVQRIEDVGILRSAQFSEDAGALAHPVRPESFVEINNFYTATVYEKGAEICRMMANMMGKEKYRQGTDEYFRRYDGQAVTVEDWLSALSSVDKRTADFIKWYRQPATPTVTATSEFDKESKTLTLNLSQHSRHVAGYDKPVALPIPVATAIFDKNSGKILLEKTLMLTDFEQTFTFESLATEQAPVLSLLRDFSAPVNLEFNQSAEELAFLLEHETNGFNRWQATQTLVNQVLKNGDEHYKEVYLKAVQKAVNQLAKTDPMLATRLLDIPSERDLSLLVKGDYDPQAIKAKREQLKTDLAKFMANDWLNLYQNLPMQTYEDTPQAKGVRALRNTVLAMLLKTTADTENFAQACKLAVSQYDNASCMTECLGALGAMVNYIHPQVADYLADFYNRFADEPLVVDMWFAVQAGADCTSLDEIQALIEHKEFDWGTPNRIRSVIGGLANSPVKLWSEQGLDIYLGVVAKLDHANPTLASRLLQPLARWDTLVPELKTIAKTKLTDLEKEVSSKNVLESLGGILGEK
ncbi:MAG: aminopeptidase N [Moraxellaceae bacterium]|nr:aminopeptidase N [Moraxellaceae bacterium]